MPPKRKSDPLTLALDKTREIKISVIGRNSGKTITLPVWFVLDDGALWLLPVHGSKTHWYRNLLKNPQITIKAGNEIRTLKARTLRSPASVRKVVRLFGNKFTAGMIQRLYPGPLDVAAKVKLS